MPGHHLCDPALMSISNLATKLLPLEETAGDKQEEWRCSHPGISRHREEAAGLLQLLMGLLGSPGAGRLEDVEEEE